jgi:hypothetical protein
MGFIKSFFSDQADTLTTSRLAYDSYNLVAQVALINLDARSMWVKGEIERIAKEAFKKNSSNDFSSIDKYTWAILLLYSINIEAKREKDSVTEKNSFSGISKLIQTNSLEIDKNIQVWLQKTYKLT